MKASQIYLAHEDVKERVKMPDNNFRVYSFDYENTVAGGVFISHWHETIEIISVTQGSINVTCNDRSFVAEKGDVLFINSNDYHGCQMGSANLKLVCVMFDMSVLCGRHIDVCEQKYLQPIMNRSIVFENLILHDERLSGAVHQLYEHQKSGVTGFQLSVKGELYKILAIMLGSYIEKTLSAHATKIRKKDIKKINSVLAYIDENYTRQLTLEELSAEASLSKFYFSKLFKSYTGKTVIEYINHYRLYKAEQLLRDTDMSVTDIAYNIGFSDINYFSRFFKKIYTISPNRFRENCRI